jgi:4-hydroxy-4-methyl-2-oxoglutarate aldolase
VTVSPGDIVIGDGDGVTVVPLGNVNAVITRLDAIRKAEAELDGKVKAGLKMSDAVKEILASDRVREIE